MAFSKTQEVIIAVLSLLGPKVYRTKLVKLLYLIDNDSFESSGTTLTGLQYIWDHYGPNALGNAITQEANKLVNDGQLVLYPSIAHDGAETFQYALATKEVDLRRSSLTELELDFIKQGVERYGSVTVRQIVSAAKATIPFKKAHQYQILQMQYDPRNREICEAVRNNKRFMRGVKEGLKAAQRGEGKTLEEIKRKYGISTG